MSSHKKGKHESDNEYVARLAREGFLSNVDVYWYDTEGQITKTASLQRIVYLQHLEANERVTEGRAELGVHQHDLKTGKLKKLPKSPAPKSTYKEKRVQAYPNIGDQLDAIWKGLQALQDGKPLPSEVTGMLKSIQGVKRKFRK